MKTFGTAAVLMIALLVGLSASADIPLVINHQGTVKVNGVPFSGEAQFKFGFYEDTESKWLWTNDGSRLGDQISDEPTASVPVTVTNGHYAVCLGHDMESIPENLFNTDNILLRVYFNDGANGEVRLTPDQKLTAAPYAFHAAMAEAVGSVSASDIESLVDGSETELHNHPMDIALATYRTNCTVVPNDVSSLTVLSGELAIPNADQSDVRYRRNTNSTSVDWSTLDIGSEIKYTQYYVYAIADNAEETTFDVVISAYSTAPSGAAYFRRIGYFYNDNDGNMVNVGSDKSGDVSNVITVCGEADDSAVSGNGVFEQIDNLEARFVTRGGNVKVSLVMTVRAPADAIQAFFIVEADGSYWAGTAIVTPGANRHQVVAAEWIRYLPAGPHMVQAKWSPYGTGTIYHDVYWSKRTLIVEEL